MLIQQEFGQAKRDSLPQYCLDCDVRFACHGGCPKDRFATTPDGQPGLHYLCPSYKAFFGHTRPAMNAMCRLGAGAGGLGDSGEAGHRRAAAINGQGGSGAKVPGRRLNRRTSDVPGQDLCPLPVRRLAEWTGGMGGKVFVSERVLLSVSPDVARAWLGRLAADDVLLGAAEYAYGQGIVGLADLAGPAAGMSRLATVRAGEISETPDSAGLGLRWEALGPDGGVFPALDANLTLSPAGEATTVLTLAGVYRLPGQAAAAVDPALARGFAAVTIRSFIARLACDLMHPTGMALR